MILASLLSTLQACASHPSGAAGGPSDSGAVDAGLADSGVTDASAWTGPVSLGCTDGGALVMTPPATFTNMQMDGLEWPLLFSLPVVTDATMDMQFLQMLEELGVDTLAIMIWESAYRAYPTRYTTVINAARAAGLKIRLGFKGEIKSLLFGLTPTFPGPTTYAQYLSTALAFEQELAQTYQPDSFNLVEEFGTSMAQVQGSFTAANWIDFVTQTAAAVKTASGGRTETWVALLPTDPVDRAVVKAGLASVPNLDGIGFDAYGSSDLCVWQNAYAQGAALIADAGRKSGFTETWWGDLFAQPQLDTTAAMPQEADWLRGMTYDAQNIGATSDFMPWFTEKLVVSVPDGFGSSDAQTAAATLSSEVAAALDAGARTQVFLEWQAAIAQTRRH